MMEHLSFETLSFPEKGLNFTYGIFPPENELPRGIVLLIGEPSKKASDYSEELLFYKRAGFIGSVISITNNVFTADDQIIGCRALVDKIRHIYKFLPIIIYGESLSSISARQLVMLDSERIAGIVISSPRLQIPSSFDILKAKFICFFKGKEFVSPVLGDYNIPLSSVISYISQAKELDGADIIEKYPKYMPTLIINADNDSLFDALDDAYVSELEKARYNTENEKQEAIASFSEKVVEGVQEALSSSSFIYRGDNT